ncbi:MAG: alpha/beta hydrolase [Pseudomonadota bacterium]
MDGNLHMIKDAEPSSLRAAPERFVLKVPAGAGVEDKDATIAGWHFPGPKQDPMVFCHANGFCASTYRQILTDLASHYDIYALDLRGHGRTTLTADPTAHRGWKVYADDLVLAIDALREKHGIAGEITVAGHSLGGGAAILAASQLADVREVKVIEPVFMPMFFRWMAKTPVWPLIAKQIPIVKGALKRRSSWPSLDDVKARYASKPLFARWHNGVLDDYLKDGLTNEANGSVRLACSPLWEAANFANHKHDLARAILALDVPVSILTANHSSSTAPKSVRARLRKSGLKIEEIDNASHLAPLEDPTACAAFLRA